MSENKKKIQRVLESFHSKVINVKVKVAIFDCWKSVYEAAYSAHGFNEFLNDFGIYNWDANLKIGYVLKKKIDVVLHTGKKCAEMESGKQKKRESVGQCK